MHLLSNVYSNPFSINQTHLLWGLIVLVVILLILGLISHTLNRRKLRWAAKRQRIGASVNETRNQELQWYREKRFLMERQATEKHERLAGLIDAMAPDKAHEFSFPAARLFFFAEAIREERQHLGTDISKLSLIDRRLRNLGRDCLTQSGKGSGAEYWLSDLSECRRSIQQNREHLRKSQILLRRLLGEIARLEEKVRDGRLTRSDVPAIVSRLEGMKKLLRLLPDGLRSIARITGERARALFKESAFYLPDLDVHSVWQEQMTLDLFSSKHRPGGRAELIDALELVIRSFENLPRDGFAPFWEEPEIPSEPGATEPVRLGATDLGTVRELAREGISQPAVQDVEVPVVSLDLEERAGAREERPESAASVWMPPSDALSPEKPPGDEGKTKSPVLLDSQGRTIRSPGEKKGAGRRVVIFRSRDPEIWNTSTDEGPENRAVVLDGIEGDFRWIGIRRLDTGEEVFSEVAFEELTEGGDGKSVGFNGSNELFYGARHLGLFSEECAPEVETRFTYGGWGFGHLVTSAEESEDHSQVTGWNGRQIPEDTILEFTIYEQLPEGVDSSQLIL